MAGDAIKYLNNFEKEAKELLFQCAKYLRPKLLQIPENVNPIPWFSKFPKNRL